MVCEGLINRPVCCTIRIRLIQAMCTYGLGGIQQLSTNLLSGPALTGCLSCEPKRIG